MPLHRLISSGSLARLERALGQSIGEQKRADPFQPAAVLCASQFLGHYVSRRLTRSGISHLGVSFVTVNQLAQLLTQRAFLEKGVVPLPDGGERLMVRRLLHELSGTSYFFPARSQPHLAAVMTATFTDIEDSRVDFASAAVRAGNKMPGSRQKLDELARHYQQYCAERRLRQMFTEADLLAEAGRRAALFPSLFGTNSLLVYGFYEHTGAQLELLDQLAAHVDITVFLLAEPGARLCASQALREWWIARSAAEEQLNGAPPSCDLEILQTRVFGGGGGAEAGRAERQNESVSRTPTAGKSSSRSGASSRPLGGAAPGRRNRGPVGSLRETFSQASLFPDDQGGSVSEFPNLHPANSAPSTAFSKTGLGEVREDDGTVRIISCPDETAEAREIAREAVRLEREAGIPFTEMAVFAHDTAYLPLLAGVFDRVGLPFYLREGLPLNESAPGRSILALLDLPLRNYARTDVVQWLTTGSLAPGALTRDGSEAPLTLWDRLGAQAGVVSGEEQWRHRLQVMIAGLETESRTVSTERQPALSRRRAQAGELLALMEVLFAKGGDWSRCRSWSALAASVAESLSRFYPPGRDREQVRGAIASLASLDRVGEATDLSEFRAALEARLQASSRQVGVLEQTGIHLLTLAAARHTRFRVVFVPGMVERSFPVAGRQDPILLDEERRALGGKGVTLPLKGSRPHEERLLFLLALGAARERLILTVPRAEAASSAAKIPSHYVLASLECLAGMPVPPSSLACPGLPRVVFVRRSSWLAQTAKTALDLREFDLGRVRTCLESAHPESSRYLERCSPCFARALAAEQAQWGTPAFTAYDGMLASPECREALTQAFSPERIFAATALERYAACPYRFFLHDVLRLRELEEPAAGDSIAAQDKGELIHAILGEFYELMKARERLPLAGQEFDALHKVLDEICERRFADVERNGVAGQPATWELNRRFILQDLERHLRREIEGEGGWVPTDFERSFGIEDAASCLEVPAGDSVLKLRGVIDRIDLDRGQGAVRVIDYKSGKRRHKLRVDLAGGMALQLPLYMLAAQAFYPRAELQYSTAEYSYLTRAGQWSRCSFAGSDLLEKQAALREILGTIMNGCRSGIFPHWPQESGSACEGCEYHSVGDPRRETLWKRKQTDERLHLLRLMREKT
jgi:RecB family exonuclease